jgi:flagellar basal body P-ring formation protein FlgA
MFSRLKPRSRRYVLANLLAPVLALLGAVSPAIAQDATAPVPNQVIYPGDIIRDGMLSDVAVDDASDRGGTIIMARAALVGKLARRTLLRRWKTPERSRTAPRSKSSTATGR